MNKKQLIWIIGILVAILLLIFFSIRKSNDQVEAPVDTAPFEVDENGMITKLNVKKQYKDGIHTVVGEVETPTPCHSVNAVAKKSDDKTVFVDVTTVASDSICAQVVSTESFIVSFEADKDAVITGTVDGNPVDFNIFEVGEDEVLSDKTLFFKG